MTCQGEAFIVLQSVSCKGRKKVRLPRVITRTLASQRYLRRPHSRLQSMQGRLAAVTIDNTNLLEQQIDLLACSS